MIGCKNVSLVYDQGKEIETYALKDVSISFDKNGIVVLVGPSGSGKSSLLYALSGVKKVTSGDTWNGGEEKNIDSLSEKERSLIRRKDFGFIFQRHFLIDYLSVIDNILVGVDDVTQDVKDRADYLMETLEIKHLARKKPFQLSGGQRQRVAIARALINSPKVVFADEPTASLDFESVAKVMELFVELKKNTLILIVTHDRSIMEKADKVIEMENGQLKILA